MPQPVHRGELIEAVELYGRGIEQAFGDRFADGCRNIAAYEPSLKCRCSGRMT